MKSKKLKPSKTTEKALSEIHADALDIALLIQFLGKSLDEIGPGDTSEDIPGIAVGVSQAGERLRKITDKLDAVLLDLPR